MAEMGEVVALLALGFALGGIVCGVTAFDKGFKSGVSWAHHNIFGREA